jgi:hypothetical protein
MLKLNFVRKDYKSIAENLQVCKGGLQCHAYKQKNIIEIFAQKLYIYSIS